MEKEKRLVKKRELLMAIFVLFLVMLALYKYHPQIINAAEEFFIQLYEKYDIRFGTCPDNQIRINVVDGYLCRNEIKEESVYSKIYDAYPKKSNGKEIIYSFLDSGDISIADDLLKDIHSLERYEPVKIDDLTWEENPYDERYWRFLFYSLRNLRHLIYAEKMTGDKVYLEKLRDISQSFIDEAMEKPAAWEDYHSVAFRSMVLVNIWWKLRQKNLLTIEYSEELLRAIEKHGEFLADEEHFQPEHNHGVNQAISLFLISYNFPNFPNSASWRELALKRLEDGLASLIDDDGVLIENSPYYQFYVLQKYWEILEYSKEQHVEIEKNLEEKIYRMMDYSANIIQPNLELPLLGASLKQTIRYAADMKEIADVYPPLLYALTQGEKGEKLPDAVYYPIAGQTIMRSEGKKRYLDKTYLVFDSGPYRTTHSDLDALHFSLYSNDITLLPDS